ncbi:MAG TPA: energy-coupling factor transporter transmembrane protein EcfT [Candidatus Krumholzibacteria bacterium]|nr:energy-coupling factor transporter transmembrane protein EcfT [Candidatus Krumholzibacteria bacterium]
MRLVGLALGRYIPRSSPLHRLDAGIKLVGAFCLATASLCSSRLDLQLLQGVVLLAAFLLARLPARLLLRALRGAAWLLAFVALANLGWAAVSGGWTREQNPAEFGVLLARLLDLVLLSVLFTATTVPVDLARGLDRLLGPLRRLRLPVHELGFLLVLALSFIPIFLAEARSLVAAHRTKMGGSRWRWWHRLQAVVPLAVPLFLSVLRRADELAVALDARCFVPGRPRTAFVPPRHGRAEGTCLALCLLVLLASVWLRR